MNTNEKITTTDSKNSRKRSTLSLKKFLTAIFPVIFLSAWLSEARAEVSIDQVPLTLSNNVPGNLVLTPSIEFPTVMSMSNLGSFSSKKVYSGYFDPNKCYNYNSSVDPAVKFSGINGGSNSYFTPANVSSTSPATCQGQWSGNYLNWAATQTIDTFRSAMTGGYRVVDETGLTVLEKARSTGQKYMLGSQIIANSKTTVSDATPFSYKYFAANVNSEGINGKGLGNQMYFIASDSETAKDAKNAPQPLNTLLTNPNSAAKLDGQVVTPYTGQKIQPGYIYSINIDVQVCAPGLLESNCVQYGSNYKPEGLIQKYSKNFTYSVFGYLNISNKYQDGAALRAKQAFVGPYTYDPAKGIQPNPNPEWDPATGIIYKNPDPDDASATSTDIGTTISDSGVINYINKAGEMANGIDKRYDPVSEMYYAAIRYLKNQPAVESYSSVTNYANENSTQNATPDKVYGYADGFPIIKNGGDPIKYSCQKNFILGIGDTNTNQDKNLPGNTVRANEPPVPSEVSSDNTVNVVTAVNKIAQLENITIDTPFAAGDSASAYLAGLAYDSHTKDMRNDLPGMQTVSTFWVDVMEGGELKPKARNVYWLAAKYGGFTAPNGYNPYTNTTPIPESEWHTNNDKLSTGDLRPDNFFTGGDGTSMVKSLSAAFSAIANQNQGSISSLALNSSQLQTGSTVYQASYTEGSWAGALKAYSIDPSTKVVSSTPLWNAATVMPVYSSRSVYTLVGGAYKKFNSSNVSGNGWNTNTVNYLLGNSTYEIQNGGTYRNRTTSLGDIINAQPIYVGAPNPNTFFGQTFTGTSNYSSFATGSAKSRTPIVYVTANDGMLHGFDATTGIETYAYMPGAVLTAATNPSVLAQANYGSGINPHQYFNDGLVTVADVYYSNAWHTVLVGTTGRGVAVAIYALDVTDPTNVKFLWEKTAASNSYIGQITGRPIIAQTANGWFALLGNGYNSSNGGSALLSIALDGSSNPAVTVYTAGTGPNNGLATPTILIPDKTTGIATTAYAGDLLGNVWKFDLSSTTGAGTLVYTTPADTAGTHQPITSPLLLGKDPLTAHLWLFFGTGKYLTSTDLADKQVQSWYGLIVDDSLPIAQSNLVQRSIVYENSGNSTSTPPTNPARAFSTGSASDLAGKSGWYINLTPPNGTAEGERMLVGNQFTNGLLIGTSLIPDNSDPCAPGGRGWVMALNPFTGSNPSGIFFDMNGDGIFDSNDQVQVNGQMVPSGGIGFSSLTGSAAFSGNVMLVNLNGTLESRQVQPTPTQPKRISWREIVNQ